MANKPVIQAYGSNSRLDVNKTEANFDAVAEGVEGCLGRGGTGEANNSMQGDLDMNTHDLLNVGNITADDIIVDGNSVAGNVAAAAASALAASGSAAAALASQQAAALSEDAAEVSATTAVNAADLAVAVTTANGVVAATPDTLPLRTATGALKAANTVNADEALVKSQLLTEILAVDGPTSGISAQQVGGLNVKVMEIGDWNMDTTASKSFLHGLVATKIRFVTASIKRDDHASTATTFDINSDKGSVASVSWSQSSITLFRSDGGPFDSTNFDSTSFNRGWVQIWYVD